jgi:hypothetical protein
VCVKILDSTPTDRAWQVSGGVVHEDVNLREFRRKPVYEITLVNFAVQIR